MYFTSVSCSWNEAVLRTKTSAFYLDCLIFFNELTNSALRRTKPKQKKTPATQLLYKVPDICTQVCSSLTRLVECVLFTLTHAPSCAHLPLYIVPRACYFGGSSPQRVQTLPGCLGTTQLQTQTGARPLLSVHTEQLQPWAALLCSCSTALSPESFESLQGRFVAVGKSLSRRGCICVWSLPRWQCNAGLLCERVAEWSLGIHAFFLANPGRALWSSV